MKKLPTQTDKNLISFKHYSLDLAKKDFKNGARKKYEVVTINWTYANNNPNDIDFDKNKPSPNYEEVHKNVYVMSLSRLIQFIRDTDDVAEDIISINPITTSRKLLKNKGIIKYFYNTTTMSAHDYLIRNGYLPAPKGKKISYQSMLVLLDNYAKTSRNYNNGNLIPISDFLRCVYIFESDKISHTIAGNLLAFYIEFISWPKYKSMSLDELRDFMAENCFWISKHISANKP